LQLYVVKKTVLHRLFSMLGCFWSIQICAYITYRLN